MIEPIDTAIAHLWEAITWFRVAGKMGHADELELILKEYFDGSTPDKEE